MALCASRQSRPLELCEVLHDEVDRAAFGLQGCDSDADTVDARVNQSPAVAGA